MHRRLVLLLVLVHGALAGCGSSDGSAQARTVQLAACADALEHAGTAAPGDQAALAAGGCRPACPGLAAWLEARQPGARGAAPVAPYAAGAQLLGGCYPACAQRLTAPAAGGHQGWSSTVEACGAEALRLPADQPQLASDDWLVLAAIAGWLEAGVRAGVPDRQVASRVEHVTARAIFRLPLPARPGLPRSRHRRAPRAAQVLLIEPGDAVRVATRPHARLRGGRLELLAVPGPYPGQVVAVDELGGAVVQHAAMLTQLLGAAPAEIPLVLADAATPLARVVAVVTRAGASEWEIAVTGASAGAHPVVLERLTSQVAAPSLEIGVDTIAIRGFGDDRIVDREHLAAELDHFTAINAPVRALTLSAHPDATLGDLVLVLDAAWDARVEALLFTTP